ncbi:2,3-bisphosphoglycerate-independent phosphoglycerate mutase [Helicovermis profundi]|uniref:2,3-bisphosphoglycerate-independent phosphoglycerate mutase n=1 Tax=Helicovermis profundi TaxID=3065157 RepID=A0AAU9E2J0_9FIRM|nr:2,3-bisphosphoglycerate-independent phosphoglycerate mutase [Clostridia bacterium S502]
MVKPVALIILDGWGKSNMNNGNAIFNANTPNYDGYMKKFPNTLLGASGLDVGLPDGQMGNSEVGHLNIGSGRVIYQALTRVTKSIKDGDFFENEVLLKAVNNAKINNSSLHLMGLLSDGGVHSHIKHLFAFLDLAKRNGVDKVYLHAFLDGRDTPPQSGINYLAEVENYMKKNEIGKIATISGRYYAMDRDQRWERVEIAYKALVNGEGNKSTSVKDAIEKSYAEGLTDEFVLPTVILENNKPTATISENDSIIFFNFRPDRAREITRSIVDIDFNGFKRNYFKTDFACLTEYDVTIKNVDVAYKPNKITNTLGEYISKLGKKQLRIAETEKYAHVTFFFNGGVEEANPNEDRVLIPSPKVATYDLMPEMSAYLVTEELLKRIDEDKYDLIILNFANPDMVGHTGVMSAAVKAVEVVDECLGRIINKLESKNGKMIITADHGNAEKMIDFETNSPMTAHTTNHVPCILLGEGNVELRKDGKLCDLAPTLLELMQIEKPSEMTGESIIVKTTI